MLVHKLFVLLMLANISGTSDISPDYGQKYFTAYSSAFTLFTKSPHLLAL
jgi:hypothetical protein